MPEKGSQSNSSPLQQRSIMALMALVQMASFPIRLQCYFGELGAGMSNGKGTKAMFAGSAPDTRAEHYPLSLSSLLKIFQAPR